MTRLARLAWLRRHAFLLAILLLYALVESFRLPRPFLNRDESALTEWGIFSRTYVKFGFLETRFGPYDFSGANLENYPQWRSRYYANHPILPYLPLGVVFKLFGVGETQIRACLLVLGLMSIVVFHALALRLLREASWAGVATLLFTVVPLFSYYSLVVFSLAWALLPMLLGLFCYWRWFEAKEAGERRRWLWGCVVVLAVGTQCDWQAYFAIAVLCVHAFVFRPAARLGCVLALLGAVATFAFHLARLWWLDHGATSPIARLLGLALYKSPVSTNPHITLFSVRAWVASETVEILQYITVGVCLLVAVGIFTLLRRKDRGATGTFLLLLPLLVIDEVVFMVEAWRHEYLTFMLLPSASLLAAVGARELWQWAGWPRLLAAMALAAVVIQSALVLARCLTDQPLKFSYALAHAIAETTRPEDRILVIHLNPAVGWFPDPYYIPFYADRYIVGYWPRRKLLHRNVSDPLQEPIDAAKLIERLRKDGGGFDVVVTARPDRVPIDPPPDVPKSLSSNDFRRLWEEYATSDPIAREIENIAPDRKDVGDFRFYRFRRP